MPVFAKLLVFLSLVSLNQSAKESVNITQILADLDELESRYAHVEGSGTDTAGKFPVVYKTYVADGNYRLTLFAQRPGEENVEACNENYHFELTKPKNAKEFTIVSIERSQYLDSTYRDGPRYGADLVNTVGFAYGPAGAAYSIFNMPLSKIMRSPGFEIRESTRSPDNEELTLTISFQPRANLPTAYARVVLAPKAKHSVLRFEGTFDTERKMKRTGTVSYDGTLGDCPRVKKVVLHKGGELQSSFEFQQLNTIQPNSHASDWKKFHLSGYGLPEIADTDAVYQPRSWSWIILASGLVLLGFGIYLMRKR